jgi:hypothetical protein
LFISRTLAEASFLSKAERIRRIILFPLPIVVKAKKNRNRIPAIDTGTEIFADLDKKI